MHQEKSFTNSNSLNYLEYRFVENRDVGVKIVNLISNQIFVQISTKNTTFNFLTFNIIKYCIKFGKSCRICKWTLHQLFLVFSIKKTESYCYKFC